MHDALEAVAAARMALHQISLALLGQLEFGI